MSGRYNNHIKELQGWSSLLKQWPDVKQSYNVAPGSTVTAFRNGADSGEAMRWGLVPTWAKEFDSEYATFNAHLEIIETKPTFKTPWKKAQRCLIPMAGYYEWQGEKGNKQPYYVTDQFTGGLVVAGLYESWKLNKFLSCTIITKPADDAMSELHPRVPVLLTPETAHDWLNCTDNLSIEEVANIARPKLSFYQVGKIVGNTDIDNANLIEPKRV